MSTHPLPLPPLLLGAHYTSRWLKTFPRLSCRPLPLKLHAVESESGAASQVATPQVTRDSPTWCALSGTLSLCAEAKDGTRVPRDPSHTGSLTEDGLYLLVPMFGSSWDGDPQALPSCLFAEVKEPNHLRLSIQAGSMLPKIHRVFRLALTSVFPLKRQFPAGDFMSALLLSLMEGALVGPLLQMTRYGSSAFPIPRPSLSSSREAFRISSPPLGSQASFGPRLRN
jgi:hypothetical protein